MPTSNILPNQTLRMDGNNGAQIVNLPGSAENLVDGDSIILATKGKVPVQLTLNAAAGDSIQGLDGTVVATLSMSMVRESLRVVYDLSNLTWFAVSIDEPPVTSYDVAPTAITAIGVQLPIAYRNGDDTLFTVNGSNQIVANYAFTGQLVELSSALVFDLAALGNNTGVTITAEWVLVSGTGAFLGVGDGATTGLASRAWSIRSRLEPNALWTPVVGDIVELRAQITDSEGAHSADLFDGLAFSTVTPV